MCMEHSARSDSLNFQLAASNSFILLWSTLYTNRWVGAPPVSVMAMWTVHWGQCVTQLPASVSTVSTTPWALSVTCACLGTLEIQLLVFPAEVMKHSHILWLATSNFRNCICLDCYTKTPVTYYSILQYVEFRMHTKRQCFWGVSTDFWIRSVTWLHSVHDIAVPISLSPQCSWWGLVLAKTCPAQWVTLHNI